jgi:hypothetical protein
VAFLRTFDRAAVNKSTEGEIAGKSIELHEGADLLECLLDDLSL